MQQGALIQHKFDKRNHWWFVLATRSNGTLVVCTHGYLQDVKFVHAWAYKTIKEPNKSDVEFAKLILQKERIQKDILKWEFGTQM
jgi:hypothetical protein